MKKVSKAIITAAGFGTRFLPATKNIPKELVPIINKPTIHYIVEQCIEAGITDIIIVTRYGNHAVEDYFDYHPAIEAYLKEKGKNDLVADLRRLYTDASFVFVRQKGGLPYGNAAPLYSAKDLVADEPFLYSWGDEFMMGENPFKQLSEIHVDTNCDVVLECVNVSEQQILKLASVVTKEGTDEVMSIVEKPPVDNIPSTLASVSPYVFTPRIFDYLTPTVDEEKGEFLIQPAIQKVIEDGGSVRADVYEGKWLNMGDPLDYLKTTVEVALSRDDLREDFLAYLRQRLER